MFCRGATNDVVLRSNRPQRGKFQFNLLAFVDNHNFGKYFIDFDFCNLLKFRCGADVKCSSLPAIFSRNYEIIKAQRWHRELYLCLAVNFSVSPMNALFHFACELRNVL